MKQMKHISWTRLLRATVAVMLIMSLLLLCGCGKKKNDNNTDEALSFVLGDGDGKLEAQDLVDGTGKIYGNFLNALGNQNTAPVNGMETNVIVTLGDTPLAMLSSLVASSGMDFDLSWLKNFGIKMNTNYDGDMTQMFMGINLNGKQIISMDVIMDMARSMMYMGLPELNKQYLSMDLNSLMGGSQSGSIGPSSGPSAVVGSSPMAMMDLLSEHADKLPSEQDVTALLNKYMNVVLGAMPTPSVTSETLSCGDVSQDVTATAYTFRVSDLQKVAEQVLNAAQNDQDLEKVLDAFSAFAVEMLDNGETIDLHGDLMEMIPQALETIEMEMDGLSEEDDINVVTFVAYTAGEEQVGFKMINYLYATSSEWDPETGEYIEYKTEVEETPSYFYTLTSGKNTAFVLSIDDGNVLRLAGTGTNKDGIANGTYTLTVDGGKEILDIQIKDFDTVALGKGSVKGTLRLIPSEDLMGNSMGIAGFLPDPVIELVMNTNATAGSLVVNVLNGEDMFVSVAILTRTTNSGSIEIPSKYVDVESDDISRWALGMNLGNILDNLEKAGVPDDILDMLQDAIGF